MTRPFVASPAQQTYFDWISHGEGSAVVEAVAGSGKTTTVLQGLSRMQGSIALIAYNNKIAKELKERTASMRNVRSGTFHGAGLSALKFAFKGSKLESDEKKVRRIVDALIEERDRKDLIGIEDTVCAVVSMAKQRGIGALSSISDDSAWRQMIEHFSLDDALPEGQEHMIPQVIAVSKIVLGRSNQDLETIDFDDMVYLPLQRNIRMFPNDWVIVDEAQDTNPTRRALARKMLRRGGRLVAVGDPCQAIYGFTGTDNDSLDQIAREHRATRLPLSVTYRCPKSVVSVAREWVSHIEAHESAPDGEIVEYGYESILDYVRAGDAVLCRYNKHLVSLVFRLIRAGVPAKIEGRQIGMGLVKLAGRWKTKTLDALGKKLESYLERETAKAAAKENERRIQDVSDHVETMFVLIDRAREQKMTTVSELQTMILEVFDDSVVGDASMVTLCSGHRSKGLEWERVHILGLRELTVRTHHDWQAQQETNLLYVMTTRAKQTLHIVSGLRDETHRRPEL